MFEQTNVASIFVIALNSIANSIAFHEKSTPVVITPNRAIDNVSSPK